MVIDRLGPSPLFWAKFFETLQCFHQSILFEPYKGSKYAGFELLVLVLVNDKAWISSTLVFSFFILSGVREMQHIAACRVSPTSFITHYEQWMETDTWRRSILNTQRDNQTQYTNSLGSFFEKISALNVWRVSGSNISLFSKT